MYKRAEEKKENKKSGICEVLQLEGRPTSRQSFSALIKMFILSNNNNNIQISRAP